MIHILNYLKHLIIHDFLIKNILHIPQILMLINVNHEKKNNIFISDDSSFTVSFLS